jgi:catechol 2,3-dioxygenase-like lactoylglutathione lyase family enzyme
MTQPQVALILKAGDLAATLAWYTSLGFRVNGTFPDDDPAWAEVERDGLVLQFVAGETPWDGPPAMTGCVYVHPESVTAVHEALPPAIAAAWGVEERPWGARELTLQDPDGYFVTFTEGT